MQQILFLVVRKILIWHFIEYNTLFSMINTSKKHIFSKRFGSRNTFIQTKVRTICMACERAEWMENQYLALTIRMFPTFEIAHKFGTII